MITPKWVGCHADNFRVGRNGQKPQYIFIHLTDGGMPDSWFAMGLAQRQAAFDASAKTASLKSGKFVAPIRAEVSSANFGISQVGEVHAYVKELDTAFHAGISGAMATKFRPTWKLYKLGMDVNGCSIGIEHQGWGPGHADHPCSLWSDAMYTASAGLVADIAARWGIPLDRDHVIGHHEVFAGHSCPGPNCSIERIIEEAKLIGKVSTAGWA